ncbi:MAG: GNAT family N-acetyltransferase [Candidatus Nanopelagicales bacterium]
MLEIAQENGFEILDEVTALVRAAHDEAMQGTSEVFRPAIDTYQALNDADMLLVYTARYGKRLVGAAVYILATRPHSAGELVGVLDVVYVMPAYRRHGLTEQLLTRAEAALQARGVSAVSAGVRNPVFGRWLQIHGYHYVEAYYEKELSWPQQSRLS